MERVLKAYKSQIQEIHIAKSQIGLSADDYKIMLDGFGVTTSLRLTPDQADKLIECLGNLGYKRKVKPAAEKKVNSYGWGKEKYECLGSRGDDYPSPRQLRALEALWRTKSREKSDLSLSRFMKRIVGKDDITWLMTDDVHKLIKSIQSLKK